MIDNLTVTHDSATCTRGLNGNKCDMCAWADKSYETVLRLALVHVDRSAAAIRARRAALLERADAESPTEGAIALAQAHFEATDWYQA